MAMAVSGDVGRQGRLLVRVARMYYEQGIRQPQIATQLHISQAKVSRLLKRAEEVGIVRVTIHEPQGGHSDVEQLLVARYGLEDAVVVQASTEDEVSILTSIGTAAATYLSDVLLGHERIGISSWSATLLAMVNAMPKATRQLADSVVQVIGGVGEPSAQVQATRLTEQLASLTGAEPRFLTAPGFVSSPQLQAAIMAEPYIRDASEQWSSLSILLAGIGSLEPSPLLRQSGNALPLNEQRELRELGAVGDVCLRFFDGAGQAVESSVDGCIVGIDPDVLLSIPRRIGAAGGAKKHAAVRAALLGRWINVLVTDTDTADYLLGPPS